MLFTHVKEKISLYALNAHFPKYLKGKLTSFHLILCLFYLTHQSCEGQMFYIQIVHLHVLQSLYH